MEKKESQSLPDSDDSDILGGLTSAVGDERVVYSDTSACVQLRESEPLLKRKGSKKETNT
jgi:hypothetical protein